MLNFINPWKDPAGNGYQFIQSFYALGSGGLTGLRSWSVKTKDIIYA